MVALGDVRTLSRNVTSDILYAMGFLPNSAEARTQVRYPIVSKYSEAKTIMPQPPVRPSLVTAYVKESDQQQRQWRKTNGREHSDYFSE